MKLDASYVRTIIEVRDANGRDCVVVQYRPIMAGDVIADVIYETATDASVEAWDRVRPRDRA